jgi:hypothetical protein
MSIDALFTASKRLRNFRAKRVPAFAAVIGMLFLGATASLKAQSDDNSGKSKTDDKGYSMGFTVSKDAKDIGLPWYPGAKLHKDKSDDTPAVQLGAWAGSAGFKLAALKLESSDAPNKVQGFYRGALGKYGSVLTCGVSSADSEKKKNNSSDQLTCESDDGKDGETVLKAGTQHNQHLVGITPNGTGTIIQLLYVQTPKSD